MSQLAFATRPSLAAGGPPKVLLIGNPNVGKSLLFTRLTNHYVTVSNYPGTTVEITTAKAELGGELCEIIDTPGTNGLTPQSNDERVARDILLASPDADVIQVGDISNLRRTLLLSLQLAEHDVAFTLCLNMSDEERARAVDAAALEEALGVPVIATSALKRWNIEKLKTAARQPRFAKVDVDYGEAIENAVAEIDEPRGVALSMLAGDDCVIPSNARDPLPKGIPRSARNDTIASLRDEAQRAVGVPLAYAIATARMAAVDKLVTLATESQAHRVNQHRVANWLGTISMHRVWGVPILLGVLYIAWLFVGKFGAGICVDFLQNTVFTGYINPWATRFLALLPIGHFIRDLLVGPYGVITMALTYAIAIVLPVVITFFTFFGILEDSGYLPRLAVMLNRSFRRMGLNGKAVLPMVLGLGCDTMATLTTRILDTKKEAAIVTLLLALGVPCSAQLGVIMAMLGPLGWAAIAMWSGVTLLTIFLVGYAASKVMSGDTGEFVLEIPPVRVPKLSNILIKVLARTEWYIKEAVPLFIVGTLVLYLLDAFHLLGALQRALSPLVVGGLGLPAESANAFVIGFLRRDYGAAGLFAMQRAGHLTPNQTVVSLTVITLFIPCVANFLVMLRERGARTGFAMAAFIIVYAFGIGYLMNAALHYFGVIL
jgi:ferrous iron transport protein B